MELDELDLTAVESKATYAEIKDYVLKVSNLYISRVKNAIENNSARKCGIEVGENYNLHKATRRMDCLQANSTTATNRGNDNSHGVPKFEDRT